jgi:tetratricopeptide (TPR) repeat protein
VPEAPAITILTVIALTLEHAPLLGLSIAVLTLLLVLRVGAMYLGQSALASARYREAEVLARLSQMLHPWSADALALRGVVSLAVGDVEFAAWLLRRSVNLYPFSATTHATLSSALLVVGRIAAARLSAQQALELDQRCALAYLYLAEADRLSGASALEIEDVLRRGIAVAQRPDDEAALRCALAALLFGEGRLAETALALGGLERLIETCTPAAQSRLRLRYGEILIARGEVERAREYLQSQLVVGGAPARRAGSWSPRSL